MVKRCKEEGGRRKVGLANWGLILEAWGLNDHPSAIMARLGLGV